MCKDLSPTRTGNELEIEIARHFRHRSSHFDLISLSGRMWIGCRWGWHDGVQKTKDLESTKFEQVDDIGW